MSPQELLFQSFRHSQGSVLPQIRIFNYMERVFGTVVDLHPMGREYERFSRYLEATHTLHGERKPHIMVAGKDEEYGGVVMKAMKDLRRYYNGPDGQYIRHEDVGSTTIRFAGNIMLAEAKILSRTDPWASNKSGMELDRPERVRARVGQGRSSFLLYHGREGQPTGREEFDRLYQEAWQAADQNPILGYLRRKHAVAVVESELDILGRLALGSVDDIGR